MADNITDIVARNFKLLMLLSGFDIPTMAEKLEISESTIKNYRSGKTWDARNIKRAIQFFNKEIGLSFEYSDLLNRNLETEIDSGDNEKDFNQQGGEESGGLSPPNHGQRPSGLSKGRRGKPDG